MTSNNLAEIGGEITKTVRTAMRRRPLSQKTKSEYDILAFELENQAKDIRRRVQEHRSFQPK
jgi:hypothetical protein